jgi:hypothetical protein
VAREQIDKALAGPELEAFVGLIDQRQSELRLDARLLGERIYAEKAREFRKRMGAYWQAWRTESKTKPSAVQANKLGAPG